MSGAKHAATDDPGCNVRGFRRQQYELDVYEHFELIRWRYSMVYSAPLSECGVGSDEERQSMSKHGRLPPHATIA